MKKADNGVLGSRSFSCNFLDFWGQKDFLGLEVLGECLG